MLENLINRIELLHIQSNFALLGKLLAHHQTESGSTHWKVGEFEYNSLIIVVQLEKIGFQILPRTDTLEKRFRLKEVSKNQKFYKNARKCLAPLFFRSTSNPWEQLNMIKQFEP